MPGFFILSCDGGGIRGLLTALVLKRLDEEAGFLGRVDLFAGTSTGGILALGLAGDLSIDAILGLYRTQGRRIFERFDPGTAKRNPLLDLAWGRLKDRANPDARKMFEAFEKYKDFLWYPLYDNRGLEAVLRELFPTDPTLASLGSGRRVLVTTLQLRSDAGRWTPVVLHNLGPEGRAADSHVVEAALSTSAAPLFFPPYPHATLGYCVDGGLFANSPGSLAMAAALRAGRPLESIRMLSVGTGGTDHAMPVPHLPLLGLKERNYGMLPWLFPVDWGQTPRFPLVSMLMESGSLADAVACRQVLEGRYRRVQVPLRETIALDEFDKIERLEAAAEAFFETPEWAEARNWVREQFG